MVALFLYWSSNWTPDLDTLNILWVHEKEPRCVRLSEAKASHSHKTLAAVSSSAPHLLHKWLLISFIKYKYLFMVLCPINRPITTLNCVLLKYNFLVFTVGLRSAISFRVCFRVPTRPSFLNSLRPHFPHRDPIETDAPFIEHSFTVSQISR